MSKGVRLTEKWLQRALWLVAFVFAAFLIGLGGKIVENLWDVEPELQMEQFIDPVASKAVRVQRDRADALRDAAKERLDQASELHSAAKANTATAHETFDNWIATRHATARPDQDTELIERTRALDKLAATERRALGVVEADRQAIVNADKLVADSTAAWEALERPATAAYASALQRKELRVFGYRLALTLPLLLIAGWLFARKRKGTYWPFAWGFILFAVFAFFFELVPYLPSYGGYVRYVVGIIVTAVAGRYAIVSLQRYLARQKENEAMSNVARRQTLSYDVAQARLAKSVCPACERHVDMKDASLDFCPHCGIGLADRCTGCATRKNAFARYCFSCGTAANTSLAD